MTDRYYHGELKLDGFNKIFLIKEKKYLTNGLLFV